MNKLELMMLQKFKELTDKMHSERENTELIRKNLNE